MSNMFDLCYNHLQALYKFKLIIFVFTTCIKLEDRYSINETCCSYEIYIVKLKWK